MESDPLRRHLARAGDFLERHYSAQPDDLRAKVAAMKHLLAHPRERIPVGLSFRWLLRAELPEGVLYDLVTRRATRRVEDDQEARAFVEKVYTANLFDVDPFETDEEEPE